MIAQIVLELLSSSLSFPKAGIPGVCHSVLFSDSYLSQSELELWATRLSLHSAAITHVKHCAQYTRVQT